MNEHYTALAEVLSQQADSLVWNDQEWSMLESIAKGIARVAKMENPQFDSVAFFLACGVYLPIEPSAVD
jgi:hypothetical protein